MDDPALIASHYQLDPADRAVQSIGGLRAYAAIDKRDLTRRLVAVQMKPDMPARARAIPRLTSVMMPHVMLPLDQGLGRDPAGQDAWFILCAAPPGPPLSSQTAPWTEFELMRQVLAPAAMALDALAERGVTHRAIRPDNLFRGGPGEPVTLGPFWAAPPAALQPDAFEPPYVAMCPPSNRGEGTVADDVYALGVLLLWCVIGQPNVWSDMADSVPRKLSNGSLNALAVGAALTPGMHDLLRGMLAEEPEHRPTPALLMVPDQARARRLATRPLPRAPRPLDLGGPPIWTARELAYGLATQPERGLALLKSGAADRWLRRVLGDSDVAVRLDEMINGDTIEIKSDDPRAQVAMVMRAIWVLDPLAPLVWRGVALFPDGLGAALAAAMAAGKGAASAALEELVSFDIITFWCSLQTRRKDLNALRQDTPDWRGWLVMRGPMGGARRLAYSLNPLLPCGSPLLGSRVVVRLADLLPALEGVASRAERTRPPIDNHVASFAAARADSSMQTDVGSMTGFATAAERLAVLRLFGRLQARLHPAPLPALAGWLLECGLIDLDTWRSLRTRKMISTRLAEEAAAGQIPAMLRLAMDDAAAKADRAAAEQAFQRAIVITAELAAHAAGGPRRQHDAERLGQDIAAGAGLIAVLGAGLVLALAA